MNEAAAPAEWQKGFDLPFLKSFGILFKSRHKPHVYGAFGLTKERDVAEAISKNRLLWKGSPPAVEAALIFSVLKSTSQQSDFTQRSITIPAGAVSVKALACTTADAGRDVLEALKARSQRQIWVEIFEEDDLAKKAVALAGLEYAFTKISAGSEIKGMYATGPVSARELPPEEQATQLVIKPDWLSPKEHAVVLAELAAYGDHFAQHYSDYNKRKSWTSFAIRGFSDDPTDIVKPAEMSKAWKDANADRLGDRPRWTDAAEHFPETRELVERLGVKLDRVRFMRLRSKNGELSRHADITDREAGIADGFVTRLHVPIITSKAVTFYGWDSRGNLAEQSFPERALCYLDQRKPHAVKNTDPSLDRTHLVIDAFADDKVRRMIRTAALDPATG